VSDELREELLLNKIESCFDREGECDRYKLKDIIQALVQREIAAALEQAAQVVHSGHEGPEFNTLRLGIASAIRAITPVSFVSLIAEVVRDAEHKGWCDALRNVLASLEMYPNGGGDVNIMQEVERLMLAARIEEAKWFRDNGCWMMAVQRIASLERAREKGRKG
jgi:hypothetical protein